MPWLSTSRKPLLSRGCHSASSLALLAFRLVVRSSHSSSQRKLLLFPLLTLRRPALKLQVVEVKWLQRVKQGSHAGAGAVPCSADLRGEAKVLRVAAAVKGKAVITPQQEATLARNSAMSTDLRRQVVNLCGKRVGRTHCG